MGVLPVTVNVDREPGAAAQRAASSGQGCGLREVLAIWLALGFITTVLFITYARVPPTELYHVSHRGISGGASRALVQLNFPTALIAVAIAGVLAVRQQQQGQAVSRGWRRGMTVATVTASGLCLIVAKPGVVDQNNLDAKWINVLPAVGVILLLALTVISARCYGTGSFGTFAPSDQHRIALALLLAFCALPWLCAEAGIYIGHLPGLGKIFLSHQIVAGETEAAVHLGHHHGADGLYLALTALLLSRVLRAVRSGHLRTVLAMYFSLMLVYGVGNMANDAWKEQIWKRGWTTTTFPNVLQPELTVAWGLVIVAAALVYLLVFRRIGPASLRPSTD